MLEFFFITLLFFFISQLKNPNAVYTFTVEAELSSSEQNKLSSSEQNKHINLGNPATPEEKQIDFVDCDDKGNPANPEETQMKIENSENCEIILYRDREKIILESLLKEDKVDAEKDSFVGEDQKEFQNLIINQISTVKTENLTLQNKQTEDEVGKLKSEVEETQEAIVNLLLKNVKLQEQIGKLNSELDDQTQEKIEELVFETEENQETMVKLVFQNVERRKKIAALVLKKDDAICTLDDFSSIYKNEPLFLEFDDIINFILSFFM